MSRIHRAVATFLMLTCAVATSIDGSFVICIGTDGHVSFERANVGCCDAGAARGGQRLDRAVGTDGSDSRIESKSTQTCGRCIDLPLLSGAGAKLHSSKLNIPSRAVIPQMLSATNLEFASIRSDQSESCAAGDRARTVLMHQRTVVLRC